MVGLRYEIQCCLDLTTDVKRLLIGSIRQMYQSGSLHPYSPITYYFHQHRITLIRVIGQRQASTSFVDR